MSTVSIEPGPAWRTKDFLTGYISARDREWYYHVGPDYCSIEWLEIQDPGVTGVKAEKIMEGIGVPFSRSDGLKVYGYRK